MLPLALQMFASMLFCQSGGYCFSKKRICDGLLLEVDYKQRVSIQVLHETAK